MTKHTEAPWISVKPKFFDPNCTRHIEDAHGYLVARINFANAIQSENEAIANADLIAAAPDQNEALNSVVKIIENFASNPADCISRLQAWLPTGCAAIAKATGEPQ